ncbi:MAG TPA: molybdate ABC transporter substrate-binding protein [Bacteroidota bacterium]|nr:molybdate ABC transporter substrate-binding protein [Bacteroidota bacterium]
MNIRRFPSFTLRTLLSVAIVFVAAPCRLSAQPEDNVRLTVFAAASLTECFNAMAREFASAHAAVTFSFNFAGSQQLAQQIAQGAPVDIFVSANRKQMEEAAKSGRIDTSQTRIFASNRLVVVYPKENVEGLRFLSDLSRPHLKIVLADKAVPVGQYSLEFLDKCEKSLAFGPGFREYVVANVVSHEENVRAVLAKVVLGEADAGIVYTSDVSERVRNDVGTIEIPDSLNVIAAYPIAPILDSHSPRLAGEFVAFILSEQGRAVLSRFGFVPLTVRKETK